LSTDSSINWKSNQTLVALLIGCFLCPNLFQSLLQLRGKLFKASLATGSQINVVKLGFRIHPGVTKGTGKVIDTPGFVEGGKDISCNDIVADKADISK
jgi:hypothetical protein